MGESSESQPLSESLIEQLIERSYAVLPGYYPAEKVARMRSTLEGIYRRLDAPPLWSHEPQWINDDLEVSGTGLVVHKLLKLYPELHRDLLEPGLVEIARGALGADMHLEFIGAVITDHSRPFFKWHNHVGGIEDEKYRRLGLRPAIESPERIAMIIYLDAMAPGTGQLLIHPRRVSGASGPPQGIEAQQWEEQIAVEGPPGTVVMLDQTTWHAALPRTVDVELRIFIGAWFAAACVPKPERVDESLFAVDSPDPLLQSVLPRSPDG